MHTKTNLNSFVICNKGYTVERLIHGWNESYNDIQEWQYRKLLEAFGADQGSYQTHQIRTKAELTALLQDPSFNRSQTLRVSISLRLLYGLLLQVLTLPSLVC